MERRRRDVIPSCVSSSAPSSRSSLSPARAQAEDLQRLHGTNERIAVANLAQLVRFHHPLWRNLNAPTA